MKILLPLLMVQILGCSLIDGIFGSEGRLPEVWVVPVVPLRYMGDPGDAEEHKRMIKKLLAGLNARIYDATDGQVRIAKFEVWNATQKPEGTPGIGNLTDSDGSHGLAFPGLPSSPGRYYFQIPEFPLELDKRSETGAHEWLHAWIGLHDEYRKTGGSASCPRGVLNRLETDSCIMNSSSRTELCRHGTHSSDTLQGEKCGMSCYDWLKKVLHDAGKGEIVVPDKHYSGPDNPPDPVIEFKY